MDKAEKYHLIDRYFEGDLNEKELQRFNEYMGHDSDFADAIALEKDLIAGIETFGNQKLKAELQAIHEEEIGNLPQLQAKNEAKVVRMRRFSQWAIAASLALGLIAAWWIINTNSSPSELALTAYEKPTFETLRGGESEAIIGDIKTFYQNENYQKAADELQLYLETHNTDAEAWFYLGICQFELGHYPQAIAAFQTAQKDDNLNDQATWHLALTYLKQNNTKQAKAELQKLLGDSVPTVVKMKEKAKQLMDKLD